MHAEFGMVNIVARRAHRTSAAPVLAAEAGLRTTAPAPSSAPAAPSSAPAPSPTPAPLLNFPSVKARGAPPPGTTQASIDTNVNLAKALYPNQPPLKPDDVDRSPAPKRRTQRHETTTNEEASSMVDRVVGAHRNFVPRPTLDGGLEPVVDPTRIRVATPVNTPMDAALLTRQALKAVDLRFGDNAPYIPLGHPPNRARRHKGDFGWTRGGMLRLWRSSTLLAPLSPSLQR